MLGSHVDITEQKNSQEGLALFRSLVDHSCESIQVLDPETGKFLDINQVGHDELG